MTGPEGRFKRRVTEKLREAGAFVQCVESGGTGYGIPDVYLAHEGLVAWLELKADLMGAWPCSRAVMFRTGQLAWADENERHGGFSFLGINYGNGFLFTRTRFVSPMNRPEPELSLFQKKLDAKELLAWMKSSAGKGA